MKSQTLTGAWKFRQSGDLGWIPAMVPGGVHTDLIAASKIPDPFQKDNELAVMWVAKADWEYSYAFSMAPQLLDEEKIFLVCDGLDTLARVSLNGYLLGQTDNMFRQYSWEVKSLLKPDGNELLVYFASPVEYISKRQATRPLLGVSQAIPGGPHLRKAPCQFGWDWGPMLPPIGIWKDIRLEGYSQARFAGHYSGVHLRQSLGKDEATVEASFRLERWQTGPLTVNMRITAPDGATSQASVPVQGPEGKVSQVIEHPELWWPNGYGKQPLYQISLELVCDGIILDGKIYQLGLRSLELRRQPDEWGESFTFVVNGVPIFAKGSDWIPADSFPTRLTDQFLEHLVRAAAETHQNMLRVWGGGFYEEDRFYDLCDRYGILIWQDMVFACSIYPLDESDFVGNTRVEVAENISRLRHHTCLALWCGNNEMELGWEAWNWVPRSGGDKGAYDQFFHHTLPEWIAELDPDHAFWPSSPSSDTPFKDVNGQSRGDAHYWDVWHGRKPFTAYRNQYPRFMSEFGFQALPPLETIATYASEEDWNMTSYIMEHHQRSYSGNGLMLAQMTDTFQMPKDFPSLVYLSLVLQAEGIRYGVEHWRRHKARVSGTLYWQLNDTWPVASWSSVDYFGRWKALHYAARRFYAPVLLSIEDQGLQMDVHVTSDLNEPWQGTVRWSLVTLGGQVLQSGEVQVTLDPLASQKVYSSTFELTGDQRRNVVFLGELRQGEQRLALNLATFVPNKHLKLEEPGVAAVVQQNGSQAEISLTSKSLARFVELKIPGKDVVFSDNYFDVPPGTTIKVSCELPEGMTAAEVNRALQLRSLYGSFR